MSDTEHREGTPMTASGQARNKDPLHYHADDEPWTADTLDPHLRFLHGVDSPPMTFPAMLALHRRLSHGEPAKARKQALTEDIEHELPPRVRQESMTLEPCPDHPGELALRFRGRTLGTQVCLTGTDLIRLRAVVGGGETESLKELADTWAARLGPGARRAVEAGHVAGYRLGVQDMERTPAYRTAPADAGDVGEFLGRLDTDELSADEAQAVQTVLDVLTRDQIAWRS